MHPLSRLARSLGLRGVRFVLIGVSGANLYAPSGQAVFATEDLDLFLPPDAENLVNAWLTCDDSGVDLPARLGDLALRTGNQGQTASRVSSPRHRAVLANRIGGD